MKKSEKFSVSGDRIFTEDKVEDEARRLATWLLDRGVGENDVVALLMWNDFPYLTLPRACALIGAYLVPLNWHLTQSELDYILNDCDVRVLIGHDHLLEAAGFKSKESRIVLAKPTPPEVAMAYPKQTSVPLSGCWADWSELAALEPFEGDPLTVNRGGIFYTSGTTGNPKGVKREPLPVNIWQPIRSRSIEGFGLAGAKLGDSTLAPGPLYHSAPNAHATLAWALGMNVIMLPRFDAATTLDELEKHQISHAHMVPTMFSRLLALPDERRKTFDPSCLKVVCHGAAPCPVSVKQAMINWFGPVIQEYYGGTETGIIGATNSAEWLDRPGTIGRAIGENEVRVINDDGLELPSGATGRVICKSLSTTSFRYHKREGSPQIDGWPGYVALGDIGHIDEAGYIFLTDRSSDIVISGGVNIYPAEIEKELITLPGVRDCAVIGVSAGELGEAVIALVEPAIASEADETTLLTLLKQHIASFKMPRKIVFVDALPREDSGKIRKRLLRDQFMDILSNGEGA